MEQGRHLILVVDDDADIRDAMRVILEHLGYRVRVASSAEEGLAAFRAERPDFIFVDLLMEEVDSGVRLAKEYQRLGNRAPVYVLSSVGDSLSASIDVGELGLEGVLQKPIDSRTLLTLLREKLR